MNLSLSKIEQLVEAAKLFTDDHRPKLEASLCAACGRWTPHDHPEAHDHLETCAANNSYKEILRTRKAKLREAIEQVEAKV